MLEERIHPIHYESFVTAITVRNQVRWLKST
jgi:hypothetical protein